MKDRGTFIHPMNEMREIKGNNREIIMWWGRRRRRRRRLLHE